MKKIIMLALTLALIATTGCTINGANNKEVPDTNVDLFAKKTKCLSLMPQVDASVTDYLMNNNYWDRVHDSEEIFYSPPLDTCIYAISFHYGKDNQKKSLLFDGLTNGMIHDYQDNEAEMQAAILELKK